MPTLSFGLDEDLDEALTRICTDQGRDRSEVVRDLVRRYVETERLRRTLQDPALVELYDQLGEEDQTLAEAGMREYAQLLREADRP